MSLIRKIAKLNILALSEYLRRDRVHPQNGLSSAEIGRLQRFPDFAEGQADFFGRPFSFSHARSFLHSVTEIFEEEIYRFVPKNESPYIIDCGANIGVSILYFSRRHPGAEIVAFEPDRRLFEMLKRNLKRFSLHQISLFNTAAWHSDGKAIFFEEGALAGSMVVDYSGENRKVNIETTDLRKFLKRRVDFLKIDIEGAENELIFHLRDLLPNVENIFLEYHGIKGQPQQLGEILNLFKDAGFSYYIRQAAEVSRYPFVSGGKSIFNQQLNIFCTKRF